MFGSPLVSIIVPIYNAEKYIDRCIRSILQQTYSNWELLLVDDGSTDSSFRLCNSYATKDDRIRVLHKENGGVSSARNYGIYHSQGMWLTFIDIDDYVHDSFLEILLEGANTVDLVVSGAYYINDRKSFLPPNRFVEISRDLPFLDEQLCSIYLMTCWGKLFKRTFILDKELYFDSSLRIGEDTNFVLHYLRYIDTIRFIHISGYYYNDEEKWKLSKYALNANDFSVHLCSILDGLNQLKKKCDYPFSKVDKLLTEYYSRLFFIYLLKVEDYRDFCIEHKIYVKRKTKYIPDSLKKKVLFFFFVHVPFISYILFCFYRRKF